MLYGWMGKILKIDLSSSEISTMDTTKYVPDFLGGKGLSIKIASEILKKGTGAYDPQNPIIFMTGPLTGTLAPTSGRAIVLSVSPRTYPGEVFTRSGFGGYWAPELKYAGYDGLIITGSSGKPVFIKINDGIIEIKDANKFWGKGTNYTQSRLKEELGEETQVICIGPAGENLVRSATIQHNLGNASGNAGFGAVMGSKMLKAIAIRGTGGVDIADPVNFIKECMETNDKVGRGINIALMLNEKIPQSNTVACSSACPSNCQYCKSRKNETAKIGTGKLNAVIHCLDYTYSTLKWNITEYDRPEIEDIKTKSLPGFGSIDIHHLVNDLGLNEWEYMSFYPWLEVFVRNGIKKIGDLYLDIDSHDFWFKFLSMIAKREGIGDIFAEGVMRAAERLDELHIPKKYQKEIKRIANFIHPAYGFPSHRLGRGCVSQPSPIWIYSMLHWAFDTRDPMSSHHQSSNIHYIFPHRHGTKNPFAYVPFEKVKKVYGKIFGDPDVIEPGFEPMKEKVNAAIWFQHRSNVKDSLLLCDWLFPRTFLSFERQEEVDRAEDLTGDLDIEAKLFSFATGINMNTTDLEKIGERISNLERMFLMKNYRRDRKADETIAWLCELPEKTDGTRLDKRILRKLFDTYYEIRGWDKETGRPKRKKMEELRLDEI